MLGLSLHTVIDLIKRARGELNSTTADLQSVCKTTGELNTHIKLSILLIVSLHIEYYKRLRKGRYVRGVLKLTEKNRKSEGKLKIIIKRIRVILKEKINQVCKGS